MNADDKRPAARPVWKLPLIVAALLIGVWQYWSWGPYTVMLAAEGTETKDFVVVCSYATKWVHSVERLYAHTSVIGHGQSVKCPRHFLGPFGVGMTASVYHPEYQEYWLRTGKKNMDQVIVLRPHKLEKVLQEQETHAERRRILSAHMSRLQYRYLPEFDLGGRNVLADRYVSVIQEYARNAGGINRPQFDQKTMEYVDNLFRNK